MKTSSKILLSIVVVIIGAYIHSVLFGHARHPGIFAYSPGDSLLGHLVLEVAFGFVTIALPVRAIWKKRKTKDEEAEKPTPSIEQLEQSAREVVEEQKRHFF